MKRFLMAISLAALLAPAAPVFAQHHGRDWRSHKHHSGGYDAARHYRSGRHYRERRLGRNDRIYRGSNGRYYCRRSDGTTGLIVGALGGGLLGNALDNGGSSTLGTLLGAGAGALVGRSIDRDNVRCR